MQIEMEGKKMANDSSEEERSLWVNQRTLLRNVDLRKYGARPSNLKLQSLWKSGGQEVIAILRAEMQMARNKKSNSEAD